MKTKMTNKELEKLVPVIVKTLRKYGIKKAGIFGSFARGEQNKESDVDILIEKPQNRKFSLYDLVGLEYELEDKLGKKIEILTYKSVNHLIKKRIFAEEIKII